MIIRLNNYEWFECWAEAPRIGIAVGKIELRVITRGNRADTVLLLERGEAAQLQGCLREALGALDHVLSPATRDTARAVSGTIE